MKGRDTETIRGRYDRVAPCYDFLEGLIERRFAKWRRLLWSKVEGRHILEVGAGTGKNFPYYPRDTEVTAIDFSPKMLKRARRKAERLGLKVTLMEMDAEDLKFPDNTFDSVVASFVFCSVPHPIKGLEELRRVCKPGGRVVLLEHVLSANRLAAWFMDRINPMMVNVLGSNMNRRTVENVDKSGLVIERVTDLALGIFKLIEARKKAR